MRIFFINASPRRNGNISKMLDAMVHEAEAEGAECEVVRVADLHVAACTGCMACRKKLACVLPHDDAPMVLEKICWADAVVVGAPCYWGNMPGNLKVVFDRIVYGMMGETPRGIPIPLHRGKKAIIVSTSTTFYPFNIWFNQTRGVVKALHEILKWSGFKMVATVERGGTKNRPLDKRDMAKCIRAIHKLV